MNHFDRQLLWALRACGPMKLADLHAILRWPEIPQMQRAMLWLRDRDFIVRLGPSLYDITEKGRAFLGEPRAAVMATPSRSR